MSQKFGLGRGLASLIPSKKVSNKSLMDGDQGSSQKITEPKENFNYFGSIISGAEKQKSSSSSSSSSNLLKEKEESNKILEIPAQNIAPNPFQPRKDFNEEKMAELAESIKEHGIIQPVVVTENAGRYELVAGERRYKAAKIAGLDKIPAIVKKANDQEKMEMALVENVQRENLNPIEEAKSYLNLSKEFDLNQETLAKKMGKSRSAVANKLRLLSLPVEIQKALMAGKISEGHAKTILALENPEKQRALFELIIKNSLTVRQAENKTKEVSVRTHKRNLNVDPEIKRQEDFISQVLGTKVKIKKSGSGGQILIDYYSKEEFDNILSKIHPLVK